MRGIDKVSRRELVGGGSCFLFHHARGDGFTLSDKYVSSYDAIVAAGLHDRLLWVLRPAFKECPPIEIDPSVYLGQDDFRR